jgi:hypothetical protein
VVRQVCPGEIGSREVQGEEVVVKAYPGNRVRIQSASEYEKTADGEGAFCRFKSDTWRAWGSMETKSLVSHTFFVAPRPPEDVQHAAVDRDSVRPSRRGGSPLHHP